MSILLKLTQMLQIPDLASKKWIYQQYDSQVMNDTLQNNGDASLVRIRGTKKALAASVDCTPRYVEADPYEGAIQAVSETYRNICATGAKPLAITNCLNFGNPQKPEIMGQIVRSIQGITAASKALDYPVVSGNVSLYNETDGKAIKPTPAIGGVGLLTDLEFRIDSKIKKLGDEVFIVGKTLGHLECSLFKRDILKNCEGKNPPKVDLDEERKNGEFIRKAAELKLINACHDISDGGLLVAMFEMCKEDLGLEIDISELKNYAKNQPKCQEISDEAIYFGEDQSRYLVVIDKYQKDEFLKHAKSSEVLIIKVANTIPNKISINSESINVAELIKLNHLVFEKKFG